MSTTGSHLTRRNSYETASPSSLRYRSSLLRATMTGSDHQSIYRQVDWSDNVHVFSTPELEPVPLADGITLWGAAHCAPANTPGFLENFRVDREGIHIGLFHGSAQGDLPFQQDGKVPHAPFTADQIPGSGLHHALVGHFHKPVDAEHHTYPGNPDPLNFGEDWQGSTVLVEIAEDGSVSRERVTVATSEVSDVRVNVTGATHKTQILQRIADEVSEFRGAVRVTLEGEIEPTVDFRLNDTEWSPPAHLTAHLDALVVQFGKVSFAPSYDIERVKQEQTVRGQFVRDVIESDSLSEDQRHWVLRAGLRALDEGIDEMEIL
ncbi:Uncharacterised protein [Mycolicibacterium thermoresistibile]|nr:Uncharacterised protein [Mycolicibacterium thermoresistibile]